MTSADQAAYARGLHAGELSTQEMRAVLAVLGWKRRELLARTENTSGG